MKVSLPLLLLLLAACGGTQASVSQTTAADDIANADDPAPFSPPPSDNPHTNDRVGVSVGGSSEEAVHLAQVYFDAVRTRDASMMRQLLGETILRRGQPLPADEEIQMRFAAAERAGFGLAIATSDFFDFAHATVTRVSDMYAGVLPAMFRADDMVVTVPMRPIAVEMLADISQRAQGVRLVIRMRPEPRILGY